MFAIYILTFTIVGLMTVVANSLFAARYAKDEITANYLLQEAVDYVRNDRDSVVFLGSGSGTTAENWNNFFVKYSNCSAPNGCYFDVLTPSVIKSCPYSSTGNGCPFLYYDAGAKTTPFYTNDDNLGNSGEGGISKLKTNFQRKIIVKKNNNPNEIDVTVTVSWKNGGMSVARSLSTSLMNWQQ